MEKNNNSTIDEELITVPILQEFNTSKVIGSLTIKKSKLPKDPNFCFSIGYRVTEAEYTETDIVNIKEYDLINVSIISDKNYKDYLKYGCK